MTVVKMHAQNVTPIMPDCFLSVTNSDLTNKAYISDITLVKLFLFKVVAELFTNIQKVQVSTLSIYDFYYQIRY